VDPAFAAPSKFVGRAYDREEAEKLAAEHGWTVKQDGGHWRRVVPSPAPQRVVETRLIRRMMGEGVIVVCAGGGGIPVVRDPRGPARRTSCAASARPPSPRSAPPRPMSCARSPSPPGPWGRRSRRSAGSSRRPGTWPPSEGLTRHNAYSTARRERSSRPTAGG